MVLIASTIYQSCDQAALSRLALQGHAEQQKNRDFLSRQWLEHWSSPPKSALAVGRHEGRVGGGEARHETKEGSLTHGTPFVLGPQNLGGITDKAGYASEQKHKVA